MQCMRLKDDTYTFSGNRPPLILGRPEEGSGYQIDSPDIPSLGDESDQRSDINFMYRISNHLYGEYHKRTI